MSENILRLDNITMQFGGVIAVNDLSLEVNKGEIVALIGPNGAGKTTAFNCVTGVYQPTNGRIEFMGNTIVRNHPQGKMAKEYLGSHGSLFTARYDGMDDPDVLKKIETIEQQYTAETEEAERLAVAELDKVQEQAKRDELYAAFEEKKKDIELRRQKEVQAMNGELKECAQRRIELAKKLDPDAMTDKVYAPTPDRITYMGIARTFQNIRLFSALPVLDNVLIAKHMRAKQNVFSATLRISANEERRMREEAMELLAEQKLDHLKDEIAGSLPYGIQRRLEIARALATNPKLLLLDEPAAGMNPQETQELGEYIVELRKNHDLTIRIYVIDFGKLISSGTPEAVKSDRRVIDAYLGVVE